MKNKLTSAIALIIFSVALVVTALIPRNLGNTDTASGTLKTGLAIFTNVKESTEATADADGVNSTAITVAAVIVDEDGKVVACEIDALGATVSFNASGVITSDLNAACLTKAELKDDYNMKVNSSIQKEWYEQVEAFEDYCIGKTADEIKGIAINDETGYVDGLETSCTMHPGNFQYVVAAAVENAAVTGANADDKLGLAISTVLNKSKDATSEDNGLAEVYSTVAATTVDADGKVTSAVIDAVQADVTFDTTGKITSDINADILTKNEKKDDYGMRAHSSIQKEWYEQAESFANYCVGKTADEIKGIAINDETGFVDGLETSCTMHPGNFQYVVANAIGYAE